MVWRESRGCAGVEQHTYVLVGGGESTSGMRENETRSRSSNFRVGICRPVHRRWVEPSRLDLKTSPRLCSLAKRWPPPPLARVRHLPAPSALAGPARPTLASPRPLHLEKEPVSSPPANHWFPLASDLPWGINKGHPTTVIPLAAKPSNRKGKQSARSAFVKSIVREVRLGTSLFPL